MHKTRSLAVLCTISFMLCGHSAFAQYGSDHHDDHHDNYQHDDHRDDRHHDDHHQGPPGYVHHDDWHQGGHIQHGDWDRGRAVDYRHYHLRRPPRGYAWREVDGNYVLAAAATGIIASVIAASSAR